LPCRPLTLAYIRRHFSRNQQLWKATAKMNSALISAMAAVAGSGVGAFASFATAWLTQNAQERTTRFRQALSRREQLYGEFIDEAARLVGDALTHHFDEPSKVVRLYAMVAKMRLFAPAHIVSGAEAVLRQIMEIYEQPNLDFHDRAQTRRDSVDILREFSQMCRNDLDHLIPGSIRSKT
jgi:hypothetical protein